MYIEKKYEDTQSKNEKKGEEMKKGEILLFKIRLKSKNNISEDYLNFLFFSMLYDYFLISSIMCFNTCLNNNTSRGTMGV